MLLLLTSAGCSEDAGADGDSLGICADSRPTCYANCDGTETLEPDCEDDGEWSCPSGTEQYYSVGSALEFELVE